jgi:hypothetical protein
MELIGIHARTYLIDKRECERTIWAAVQGAATRRLGIPNKLAANAAMRPKSFVPEGLPSKAGVCFVASLGHMNNYATAARFAHPPALEGNASRVSL